MKELARSTIDLAIALTWREIVIRYKRSALGVVWALFDPALQVLVYFAVFGVLLDVSRGVEGYVLFTAMGVLPWLFFSMTSEQAAGVLVEHAALIRKIAFPHEVLVVAVVVSRLTSLLIGAAVSIALAAVAAAVGLLDPNWSALPFALLGTILILAWTTGTALVVSALHVVLGDVVFLVRFALRIGFYACPVVYPLTRVPEAVRPVYELNPLVAIIWCFQAVSSRDVPAPGPSAWVASSVGAALALGLGWLAFRRMRGVIAELV